MIELSEVVRPGTYFIDGDRSAALGALAAGCTFCSYYPITPASELFEYMAELLPKIGGVPIQMEDELASINAALGASIAGKKAMTASSGPGLSLKQHERGWGIINEIPLVIIDVQRAGPSNGVATLVGQGDFYQARYGTHGGNYEAIAISPSSVQETFDLTIEAFNLAEIYRTPVILLMDEAIAHTREKLVVPPFEELKKSIIERKKPSVPPGEFDLFPQKTPEVINYPFPAAGDGYGLLISPYTRNEKGVDSSDVKVQDQMVKRLIYKIRAHVAELTKVETAFVNDADIAIASWGCAARPSLAAVRELREEGLKVGYIRLIGMWPFPDERIHELAKKVNTIFVVEENLDGQVSREVQRASMGTAEVVHLGKAGVEMHMPSEIVAEVKKHLASKKVLR